VEGGAETVTFESLHGGNREMSRVARRRRTRQELMAAEREKMKRAQYRGSAPNGYNCFEAGGG
jgi:hypothetical protein